MTKELLNDMFELRSRLESYTKHLQSRRGRERAYQALRTVEETLCEEVEIQEKDEVDSKKVDFGTIPQ